MQNDYNRGSPHNKTQKHIRISEKEKDILLGLFNNDIHRKLAKAYYVDGHTLEQCAEIIHYSKRQTERLKWEIDKIAFYQLLTLVTQSENAMKLARIKKILWED